MIDSTKRLKELLVDPEFIEELFKTFSFVLLSTSILLIAVKATNLFVSLISVVVFICFISLALTYGARRLLVPVFESIEATSGRQIPNSLREMIKTKEGLVASVFFFGFMGISWLLIELFISYN